MDHKLIHTTTQWICRTFSH